MIRKWSFPPVPPSVHSSITHKTRDIRNESYCHHILLEGRFGGMCFHRKENIRLGVLWNIVCQTAKYSNDHPSTLRMV